MVVRGIELVFLRDRFGVISRILYKELDVILIEFYVRIVVYLFFI